MGDLNWKNGFCTMDREERRLLSSCIGCSPETLEYGGQLIYPGVLGFFEGC
jgi:hypothetical protein